MRGNSPIIEIFLENAVTFTERSQIYSLTEADMGNINNNMISKLYKSIVDKAHIDFDDIPKSKGNITKYTGYVSMVESLQLLHKLMEMNQMKVPEIDIIEKAINNITANRESFETGFKLGNEFIMLQYNVLVTACVESTSVLISSYVDFVKKIDKIDFVIINSKINSGSIAIDNLDKFNKTVANGDFGKVIRTMTHIVKESFIATAIAIPIAVVGVLTTSIYIVRELIFKYYEKKSSISNWLEVQASFLEINRFSVEANEMIPPSKKEEILRKQEMISKKFRTLADKLKVNSAMSDSKAKDSLKKENSGWKLNDIKTDSVSSDMTGFQLL